MEKRIEELRASMEQERAKIYSTVKEKLAELHGTLTQCKERVKVLEDNEQENDQRIKELETDNHDLLQENGDLKKTLARFSEPEIEDLTDDDGDGTPKFKSSASSPFLPLTPTRSPTHPPETEESEPRKRDSQPPVFVRSQSERSIPLTFVKRTSTTLYESVRIDDS